MNVTRRNNGLAITGTDNEIIALLASVESGLLIQAGVMLKAVAPFKDATSEATRAEVGARCREIKRLRLLAEDLHQNAGLSVEGL